MCSVRPAASRAPPAPQHCYHKGPCCRCGCCRPTTWGQPCRPSPPPAAPTASCGHDIACKSLRDEALAPPYSDDHCYNNRLDAVSTRRRHTSFRFGSEPQLQVSAEVFKSLATSGQRKGFGRGVGLARLPGQAALGASSVVTTSPVVRLQRLLAVRPPHHARKAPHALHRGREQPQPAAMASSALDLQCTFENFTTGSLGAAAPIGGANPRAYAACNHEAHNGTSSCQAAGIYAVLAIC